MKIKTFLIKMYNQILGLFPSPLPQGLTEWNAWKQSIVETYTPPGDDRSIQFILSSLVMRLGPSEAYKSKFYFANSIKRAAASQIAVYVQEEIKKEQRAEQEVAAKKLTNEGLDEKTQQEKTNQ